MESELVMMLAFVLLGTCGAICSFKLPGSGKAAFALGLVPFVGVWLAHEFC